MQHAHRVVAPRLVARVLLAAALHFQNVPAELGAEGRRDFVHLGAGHRLLELAHETVGGAPAEVAAGQRGARVVRVFHRQRREVLAGDDALAQFLDGGAGFVVRTNCGGFEQDVAHEGLAIGLLRSAALVQQLDDVEAGGIAQRLGDAADLQRQHLLREQARQPARLAPTKVAAFERRRSRRVFHRHGREIGALAQLLNDRVRLGLHGLAFVRVGALFHRQQDVADAVLVGNLFGEERRGEQLVDVLLGDVDAAVDHLPLHPIEGQLAAHLVAEGAVGDALAAERADELVDVHAVLRRVVAHGVGERFVVHQHAAHFRFLQLDALDDQAFQNLFQNRVLGRRFAPLRLQALHHRVVAFQHFARQHHVVVDDGDDAVHHLRLRVRGSGKRQQGSHGPSGGASDAQMWSLVHRLRVPPKPFMPRARRPSTPPPTPASPRSAICSNTPWSVPTSGERRLRGASMVRCQSSFASRQQLA